MEYQTLNNGLKIPTALEDQIKKNVKNQFIKPLKQVIV